MIYDAVGKVHSQEYAENIKRYGVKGNGSDDDTALLNYAFQHSKSLYMPAGIYKISKTVEIPDNVKLTGDGENTVFQVASQYELTGYAWRDSFKYPFIHVGANCVLRDFKLNGDETAPADQQQVGIWVYGDNTQIRHVITRNINYFPDAWIGGSQGYGTVNAPAHAIFAHYCKNVLIDSCSCDGSGYQGIGVEGVENAIISSCFVGAGNRTGIQVHRYSKNVTIRDCTVDNPNSNKHSDITIHGHGEMVSGVSIIGCNLINPCEEKAAILTVEGVGEKIVISNCRIRARNIGISLCYGHESRDWNIDRVMKVIVEGNVIQSENRGLDLHGEYVVVGNNIIESAEVNPITITGEHYEVNNNLIITTSNEVVN